MQRQLKDVLQKLVKRTEKPISSSSLKSSGQIGSNTETRTGIILDNVEEDFIDGGSLYKFTVGHPVLGKIPDVSGGDIDWTL